MPAARSAIAASSPKATPTAMINAAELYRRAFSRNSALARATSPFTKSLDCVIKSPSKSPSDSRDSGMAGSDGPLLSVRSLLFSSSRLVEMIHFNHFAASHSFPAHLRRKIAPRISPTAPATSRLLPGLRRTCSVMSALIFFGSICSM